MMNNPARDPVMEIAWAGEHGFDFVDLTLEPPKAGADVLDAAAVRAALAAARLGVVGHTAWYLPFASPLAGIRAAAIAEMERTFPVFAAVGVSLVNIHPDHGQRTVGISRDDCLRWNVEAFAALAPRAAAHSLRLMVENVPGAYETVAQFGALLDADVRLGWHFDIAHAQVRGNRAHDFLTAFGERLVHVHLSDNTGREDSHLPLGGGRLDWKRLVRAVKRAGYDGTVTLEVFSDDRDYLLASQRKLRAAWDAAV